jgi:hypothetical protein
MALCQRPFRSYRRWKVAITEGVCHWQMGVKTLGDATITPATELRRSQGQNMINNFIYHIYLFFDVLPIGEMSMIKAYA